APSAAAPDRTSAPAAARGAATGTRTGTEPSSTPIPVDKLGVIPGRTEGANPESSDRLRSLGWIPGSALRAAPE
ncbi:hypothetical protein PQJ75_15825, partial [Rhodoplanes sp. TEM]|uniref:hypothetical protein n=1 Tax=Rhodoplanes sp. TEM TaxID=3025489 RepID=UPI00235017EA